jgi:excisionase family DNA binding protein
MNEYLNLLNQLVLTQQHLDETLTAVLVLLSTTRNQQGSPPASEWLAIEQAAEVTGTSATTIRRALRKGELRAANVGRSLRRPTWRIRRADLEAFMKASVAGSELPATQTKSGRKPQSRHFPDL